jgi:hypothetical protein
MITKPIHVIAGLDPAIRSNNDLIDMWAATAWMPGSNSGMTH